MSHLTFLPHKNSLCIMINATGIGFCSSLMFFNGILAVYPAVVGGLLSAHLLSKKAGVEVEAGWPCSGPLLRMAEEAARKLLPGENSAGLCGWAVVLEVTGAFAAGGTAGCVKS